ncbi:hypothetical protein Syun_005940 [Stephania yunnanensis]|uniref:Uncharacterized protein n=1 Tax=Stephania yunnanensis TaxID=152371 RepID=A0AAP0KZ30_9MAGN
MVVLAKVVPPPLPSSSSSSVLAKSMTEALCEAFQILYYIDKKMNVARMDSIKLQLAKLLSEGGKDLYDQQEALVAKLSVDLTTHMPSARDQLSKLSGTAMSCICVGFMAPSFSNNEESENVSNMASLSIFVVTVAVNICIQLGTGVIFSFVAEHIIIMCWEGDKALDVLSEPHISLLLYLPDGPTILESIRHFLAQLPNCVFKQVNDGSVEDCQERARFIAKHLCELPSSLEDKVQWKVPVGFPNTPHFFDSSQDHVTATSQNVLP